MGRFGPKRDGASNSKSWVWLIVDVQPGASVGPQRRNPYRQFIPPAIQLPVRSGLPLAVRGVGGSGAAAACRGGPAGLGIGLSGGAGTVTLIAFCTLAGTGMTTYTLPVSVSVVVRSRRVAPLRRSVSLPAYNASTLLSGLFQSL